MIKTMNGKRMINSQLSTTESKKKTKKKGKKNRLSKQLEQEQNHRNGDHIERYHQGKGGRNGGKGIRNK